MIINIEEIIIYEDADIIALHKPAGLATQTSKLTEKDLVSLVKGYLKGGYVGVINRLDQPVEGIVLMAKSSAVAAKLTSLLNAGKVDKRYRAIVYGVIENKSKTVLSDYMVKDGKTNLSRICGATDKDAREAILEYEVIKSDSETSTLDIHLITGRHHQIRLQMSNMGHPILGDKKYGNDKSNELSENLGIKNVKLLSYYLRFEHPTNGKTIELKI